MTHLVILIFLLIVFYGQDFFFSMFEPLESLSYRTVSCLYMCFGRYSWNIHNDIDSLIPFFY